MPLLGVVPPESRLRSAAMPAHLETLSCTALSMPISTHTTQSLPKGRGVVAEWLGDILFNMSGTVLEIMQSDAVL